MKIEVCDYLAGAFFSRRGLGFERKSTHVMDPVRAKRNGFTEPEILWAVYASKEYRFMMQDWSNRIHFDLVQHDGRDKDSLNFFKNGRYYESVTMSAMDLGDHCVVLKAFEKLENGLKDRIKEAMTKSHGQQCN